MIFPSPALRICLLFAVFSTAACSGDSELRAFRESIPSGLENVDWLGLAPLGAFAPTRPEQFVPDPRTLAQRAAALRVRARALHGPVLTRERERRMTQALLRYN